MLSTVLLTPTALARRALGVVVPLPSPLRGRAVLVTGASSGIGAATARQVAERGATVLLVARREDRLRAVATRIEAGGGSAYTYACDLTDAEAVDALVTRVLAEHGQVDYLVNNAGRSIRRSLELSYDRFHDVERTMAINYFGPVRLILALMPSMREQRFGHVVNVLTWGVQVKAPKFSAYIASKTALDTFSRIAGREAFGDNVTFSNVRLSLVRTDMVTASDAYRRTPARSSDQAAAVVVRALEDRPLTVDTALGSLSEVANLVAPRLADAFAWAAGSVFPDSREAKGLPAKRDSA